MEKQAQVVQVAPIIPLPVSKNQVFSYESEMPVNVGALIRIPFRRRWIEGIVLSSSPNFSHEGSFELKKIAEIIEENFLTAGQISLAHFIASRYLAPLGIVLKQMVPKRVGRNTVENEGQKKEKRKSARIPTESKSSVFAVVGEKNKRKEYVVQAVKQAVKSSKQCLILVPEVFQAYEFSEQLKKIFPKEEISLVHGKAARGRLYGDWKKIKRNDIKLVVSTKVGVFLPFFDLGVVVVLDPQDASHKQSEALPRFNAAEAAGFMADFHNARLVFSSSLLPVEKYPETKEGKCEVVDLGKKVKKPNVEIVNLAPEKKKYDFPITDVLYRYLARAVKTKRQALLIVNRKGLSTFSKCQGCGNILKCPKCQKSLVYFGEYDEYRCLHCSHKADLLSSCPNCGGFQFSHHGIGIQMVEKKLKKLFPSIAVARLDSGVMKSAKKYKKIEDDFASGKTDFLVGTQIAARDISAKDLALVAIVAAHDFLNLPDFRSRENALSIFLQSRDLLGKNGVLVVQTFFPDDPAVKALQGKEQAGFLESEMKFRKKMGYPPFERLIKISYRGNSKKSAETWAKKAFDDLLARSDNKAEISDPYESSSSGKRGFFIINILIRISREAVFSDMKIFPVVRGLGKGWVVDVDPVTTN